MKAEEIAKQLKEYLGIFQKEQTNDDYLKLLSLELSREEKEELVLKCFISSYFARLACHSGNGYFVSLVDC